MRVSLKDIAQALNVSITTVSWTLSGQGDRRRVSRVTQQRVLEYAKKVDYQPNRLARALYNGYSGSLGLVIPDIGDSFYSAIASQIEDEAERAGYSLMICCSQFDYEREDRMLAMLRSKQVDGIMLSAVQRPDDAPPLSLTPDVPSVAFDQVPNDWLGNSITVNDREAAQHIVSEMLQCGVRHPILLSVSPDQYAIRQRRMGYKDALRYAGLPITTELEGAMSFQNFRRELPEILHHILESQPQADGIFMTTHLLLPEVYRYFQSRGVSISQRFRIGSFHENETFRLLIPDLRVVQMPIRQIGTEAVRILCEQIHGKMSGETLLPEQILLKCTFA